MVSGLQKSYRMCDVLVIVWNPLYDGPKQTEGMTLDRYMYIDLLILQTSHSNDIFVVKNRQGETGVVSLAKALKLHLQATRRDR